MSYLPAVILGVVQGLTEFLPISSSGHLILVPHVFGWRDQGLAFDAVTHIGTLAALVAYFRGELLDLARGALSRRVALILIVATIPAGVVGLLFGKAIETGLRSPLLIAATTAFWGVVMWLADRRTSAKPDGNGDPLERVGWGRGVTVGVAQAIALIPGTSRSGITITAGLFTGLDRATAARFSFLLGIPITAAAGGYKLLQLLNTGLPAGESGPLVAGVLAAFVSGWFAVWFLVGYLRRRSLTPFVIYRLLLALAILLAVR
ncbi:MAG: undecaprenyl-diphosphatase UppP [Candidatus Rokubacteria bacterium]|nr:undecaprenyl-diphosphatase UppP [Candidatus Rokubacteria bacterium]